MVHVASGGRPVRHAAVFGLAAACLAFLAAGLVGCNEPAPVDERDDVITVASFDFAESAIIAEIYVATLRGAGERVEHVARVGSRETMLPALQKGLVDVVPEYAGSAVEFLGGDATAEQAPTHAVLEDALAERGIDVLTAATAQTRNALVVTAATAAKHRLRTVSDLSGFAAEMTIGGPPECPERPLCLPGLQEVYGITFQAFVPLDVGGPVTAEAVERGIVDVGILFTTDPSVAEHGLVVLVDDRGLQPAENVTPLVRTETLERFGPRLSQVLEAVSAELTTEDLRGMNERVLQGATPVEVAKDWLVTQGLLGEAGMRSAA